MRQRPLLRDALSGTPALPAGSRGCAAVPAAVAAADAASNGGGGVCAPCLLQPAESILQPSVRRIAAVAPGIASQFSQKRSMRGIKGERSTLTEEKEGIEKEDAGFSAKCELHGLSHTCVFGLTAGGMEQTCSITAEEEEDGDPSVPDSHAVASPSESLQVTSRGIALSSSGLSSKVACHSKPVAEAEEERNFGRNPLVL